MGKQKQQVISRFFAPKPQNPSSPQSLPLSSSQPDFAIDHNSRTPPPKISASVTFSPSKRLRNSQLISPSNKPSKIPELSLASQNSKPSLRSSTLLEFPSSESIKRPRHSPHTHTHNPMPPLPDPTLHQRFIDKLLEPSQDLLEPSHASRSLILNPKYTPLEQQVVELKAQHPDVLLMVEVGYRYRFFGEDAENAARVLGIFAHMDHNFLTASVPTFRLNVHVRRLVNAGYKVGVVKQTETAAIKAHGSNRLGPFGRGLSALYSKATLEAAEHVGGDEERCGSCNNYFLCVVEKNHAGESEDFRSGSGIEVKIGVVGVEVSTGDVVYGQLNDDFMRTGLESMILSLSPAELLLGEPLSGQSKKLLLAYAGPSSNARVEYASRCCFDDGGALADVISLYADMNATNLEDDSKEQDIQEKVQGNKSLAIEVLRNNFDGSESGSLLQCMNHTLTIFGSRLLKHWVTHPLTDRNMIYARLDAVSEIVESMDSCRASFNSELDNEDYTSTLVQPQIFQLIYSVLATLGRAPDIQRGITRIFHRTATASEFILVIQAILFAGKQLQRLCLEGDKEKDVKVVRSLMLMKLILTASSFSLISIASKLLSSLNKEAACQHDLHNLFVISDGKFPKIVKAKAKVQSVEEKLNLLIDMYQNQLGVCDLKFMSVAGVSHLIELPLDMKVPPNWVKVNSTKKAMRYHPPEVLSALDQLSLAEEELTLVCRAAWDSFLLAFSRYYADFQAAVQALATLDCLYSLAILSRNKNYVRPVFVNDNEPVQIHICSGRHPVMETVLHDNFVPNNTNLHADREYCQIVNGPNMGGKSCYIRQVALIVIMAQVGSFVPASSVRLHVLDAVYSRMGASDNIRQGRSTFLEELSEASHILGKCKGSSLVILDELGRGTSTHDGVAIAYATLQYLLEKKSMVLFVTHYPNIVDVKHEFPGSVGAYHVSYLTSQGNLLLSSNSEQEIEKKVYDEDITYLYKLVPGISDRSFGFKVAQLAQLPSSCILRAISMAKRLEAAVSDRQKNGLTLKWLKESLPMEKADGVGENKCEWIDPYRARVIQDAEELANVCKDLFSVINSASLANDDASKCSHFLCDAKTLAMDGINRFERLACLHP